MPEYTYTAYDWATKVPILDLPLTGVTFDDPLNADGSLTGELSLDRRAADRLDATDPARTLLCVDREGVLVWGGWNWQRSWSKSSRKMKLTAGQFGSYFARRILRANLDYVNVDQFAIADALITYAQGISGGNVGLILGSNGSSGVLRERHYIATEGKFIGELLKQLSAVENGFDFGFDVQYSSGLPQFTFNKHYPQRGLTKAGTDLIFEYPGNIITYEWPEDGSQKSNYTYEIGGQPEGTDSGNSGPIVATADDAADRPAYPLLETLINRSDVSQVATLQGYANEDLRMRKQPVTVPTITVRGDVPPYFGSITTGSWCLINITDERFPEKSDGSPGLSAYARIVNQKVKPKSTEENQLILDAAQ